MNMNLSKAQRDHMELLQRTIKKKDEQIEEMQLLIDQANKKLTESHIANVILSRLDGEIEKLNSCSGLSLWNRGEIIDILKSIKQSAISHPKISGV